ncbi:MAG TPA: hypothetical protein VF341_13005 [Anaeromyxobacteraceae bacterium]
MRSSSLVVRIVVATAIASASGVAMAQSAGGSSGGTGTSVGDESQGGRVQRVEVENHKVVLEGDRQLELLSNTEIVRDGIHTSLSDVQPGDEVRASYYGGGAGEGPIARLVARSPDRRQLPNPAAP